MLEMKKCYKESKKRGITYVQYKDVRMKHVIEGRLEGSIEVTGKRGRRSKQLLDDHKEKRGNSIERGST